MTVIWGSGRVQVSINKTKWLYIGSG